MRRASRRLTAFPYDAQANQDDETLSDSPLAYTEMKLRDCGSTHGGLKAVGNLFFETGRDVKDGGLPSMLGSCEDLP